MITKQANITLIAQIAALFYPNNAIGKGQLIVRLMNYLTDDLFEQILARIQNGNFYYCKFVSWTARPAPYNDWVATFKMTDLFKGNSFNFAVGSVPTNKKFDLSFIWSRVQNTYMGSIALASGSFDIVHDPNSAGYGIVYEPAPIGGSGSVIPLPSPPVKSPEIPVQTSPGFLSSIDFSNPMVLGGIALAVYFLFLKD